MSYPQVQFVAAPEDGAEVLFDFNNDLAAAIEDGTFSLGTPEIQGDPDGLGVQYGPRTIEFDLLLHGTRGAALATQATLARTFMLRRRGWLRIRLDDLSEPVWARTYTPTPGELDFSMVLLESNADTWRLSVEVAAEPFIRGERITLPSATITNDPAFATNPMTRLLPAIVGDAPAPLRIKATFSAAQPYNDVLLASSVVPDAFTPVFWQIGTGDAWTDGLNVGTEAIASFSGGSGVRVSFGTPAMNLRLSGVAPTTPPAGRYRLFVRAERTAITASHFKLQAAFTSNLADAGPVVSWDRGPNASVALDTWIDLGSFNLPLPRGDADLPVVSSVPTLRLYAERVSGTSDLLLDAFALIPEDLADVTSLEPWEKSSILVTEFGDGAPTSSYHQVWDGDSESTFRLMASGVVDTSISGPMRGQFPRAFPGVQNLLTVIHQTRLVDPTSPLANNSDSINNYADVEVSYQPRWLYLGAG